MKSAVTPLSLGTDRLANLLLRYAIPSIIAMTSSSLYNIIDSIFIGHGVGALAISGLAITLPLMNIASAFGSMVGIGAGGHHIHPAGRGKPDGSREHAGQCRPPEHTDRHAVHDRQPAVSGPHPLFLRGERTDDRLRPRLHADYPGRSRRNPYVSGTERSAASFRIPAESHVHHVDRP